MERDYTIVGPGGRELTITGPSDATPAQLRAAAERAFGVSKPEPKRDLPFGMQTMANAGAGLVRGAGSIGATLLTPYDLIAGNTKSLGNPERRAAMDEALGSMGVQTDSIAYGAGKLGGEIAGTAGMGGMLARGASAIPGVASKLPGLVNAVRTSGMTTGSGGNLAENLGTRAIGGGLVGGASAGMVNPEDAGTGAAIGAVLPAALLAGGKVGGAVGGLIKGPSQTPELTQAITAARNAGYVIPPSQAKPTLVNRLLEGMSGKITTAQNASARNAEVTNRLAAKAVGLPVDAPITPESLKAVRTAAGQAYEAVGQTGTVTPTQAYNDALDKIVKPHLVAIAGFPNAKPSPVITMVDSLRTDAFDAASAVAMVKELRTAADDAFRTGNTDIGRASKAAANALEDALEKHLEQIGQPELLNGLKEARQLIAKTYSVESAINPVTGTVDARKLTALMKKGKPLSGELKSAAEFAGRFPKAAQPVEGMGSLPQTSPLDWAMGGGLAMGTGNPLMMASMAARPAARSAVLSPLIQNRLAQKPGLLPALNPDLAQFGYRAAPVLLGDR